MMMPILTSELASEYAARSRMGRALDCWLSEEVSPPREVARSLARWGTWHEWTVTELSKKSLKAGEVSSSWREGLVVEIRLVRLRACARAIHVIIYIVFM